MDWFLYYVGLRHERVKAISYFRKGSILDVWLGFKYAFGGALYSMLLERD